MKKIFIKIFYILLFSLFLLSCGLPSYNVVNAPVVVSSDVESESGFKRFYAPAIDTNIDGYEIYYKIYTVDDPDIATDKTEFDNDNSSYVYELGNVKPVKLGFHRLSVGTLETNILAAVPLISSDDLTAGLPLQIFLGTIDDEILINNTTDIGIPLRDVKDVDYYKPFAKNVIESDSDSNEVTISDSQYSVSLVAYSYVSITEASLVSNSENSIPVFLGTLTGILNN